MTPGIRNTRGTRTMTLATKSARAAAVGLLAMVTVGYANFGRGV